MVQKRQKLSLKNKALQYLSLREHSRQELHRKLMRYAAKCAASDNATGAGYESAMDVMIDVTRHTDLDVDVDAAENLALETTQEIDALLDWLESTKFLSSERFSESFVRRRQESYGSGRILAELNLHQLDSELMAQTKDELAQTEEARAQIVWQKKFGNQSRVRYPCPDEDQSASAPVKLTAEERMRQYRFLAQRGFTHRAIQAVLQAAAQANK
jgi:regulatory protein